MPTEWKRMGRVSGIKIMIKKVILMGSEELGIILFWMRNGEG